jgi:NAD(P)-dependent dehydrogenase (short-subunit alcohol dehydrogenase family)
MLTGCKILVTGGSSGIGNSIARGLVIAGADVFILSRRSPDTWERPMPETWPAKSNWIAADFYHLDRTIEVLNRWLNQEGEDLSVLIHSAVTYGSNKRRSLLEMNLDEWDHVFKVGPYAYFSVTKLALPYLLKQPSGLIISISSEVAYHSGPGRIDYAASKAASRSFSMSIAEELKDSNVNVVDLLPENMVDTPGIRKRRPIGATLSDYASPDTFIPPILEVVERMGEGMHGKAFMVTDKAEILPLGSKPLPSQTHYGQEPHVQNDQVFYQSLR